MSQDQLRDGHWSVEGTYENQMINCGRYKNNEWVHTALTYIPNTVLDGLKKSLSVVCAGEHDGKRLPPRCYKDREIIVLSELIFPRNGEQEDSPRGRYFTFVVLHEVAHAHLKHRTKKCDGITEQEDAAQEKEADDLALLWYNDYIEKENKPYLQILTEDDITEYKARIQAEREAWFNSGNRP